MMIINLIVTVTSGALVAFQCVPLKYIFAPFESPQRKCINGKNLSFSIPAFNVILDITVSLLPVRVIMTISLPGKRKAMILAMLGLGALYVIPWLQ